jgi:hypothetical protein
MGRAQRARPAERADRMNPITLALATQRLTQLVTEDELTRPVREAINSWAAGAEEFSFKDRVATLASCPACISVWAGGAVLIASRFKVGQPLVRILAGSGVALLLTAAKERLDR